MARNNNNNIYFDENLKDNGQSAIDYYRTRGADKNSIVADPLFRDINNGDFRLMENSPAFKLGFKDIDMKSIGLTRDYPTEFNLVVVDQLGVNYDNFKYLEKICNSSSEGKGSFEAVDGI